MRDWFGNSLGYWLAIIGAILAVIVGSIGAWGPYYIRQSDTIITHRQAVNQAIECTRAHGLVWAIVPPARCPDVDKAVRPVQRHLARLSANLSDVAGARIIFVSQPLMCGKIASTGCHNGADIVAVQEGLRPWWGEALKHEFGHLLSLRRHGDPDIDHQRPYYPSGGIW